MSNPNCRKWACSSVLYERDVYGCPRAEERYPQRKDMGKHLKDKHRNMLGPHPGDLETTLCWIRARLFAINQKLTTGYFYQQSTIRTAGEDYSATARYIHIYIYMYLFHKIPNAVTYGKHLNPHRVYVNAKSC